MCPTPYGIRRCSRLGKAITIIFGLFSAGYAQQSELTPSAMKALGAPNEPVVEVAWNRYYDSEGLRAIGERLADAFPDRVQLETIGHSVQGEELFVLILTQTRTGDASDKPAMYIDGNIHSNELQGSEVALYTAWYLAESYGKIQWITDLLDRKTFYIIPTINPDARDFYIHSPNTPHSPRSGLLPRDDDQDGRVDEDGFDDLDGDGHIVQMRMKRPDGRWMSDPDDPRLLVRTKPDQIGDMVLLGWEGLDNDGDGRINEDGPGYYDPNRNWGWNWQPDWIQRGSDQYPFSIPENRAVADFVIQHPNIGGAQSYHNTGGMILRGPGAEADQSSYLEDDIRVYDILGNKGEDILPGYRYLVVHKDMYSVYGGELDWFYGARGIYTFTNELWTSFQYFKDRSTEEGWFGRRKDLYRFDRLLLFGEGIVDWTEFDHPQYGKIEIGGIKKNWSRTAPSFLMEEMCHRNMAFTLYHAYQLPVLTIDTLNVRGLDSDLWQVEAVIRNHRVVPTRSARDCKYNIVPPDRIAITGENISVIAGFVVEDPYLDRATEQKYRPDELVVDCINGMDRVVARWIVKGKNNFSVRVRSVKGGMAEKKWTE
jgi:murein tripeptide amidase MpaA